MTRSYREMKRLACRVAAVRLHEEETNWGVVDGMGLNEVEERRYLRGLREIVEELKRRGYGRDRERDDRE